MISKEREIENWRKKELGCISVLRYQTAEVTQ